MAKAAQQAVLMQTQRDWSNANGRIRKVLVLIAIVGSMIWLYQTMTKIDVLPINKIKAQGSFTYVTEAMLQKALGKIDAGYFSINVNQIQQQVEALPWVDKAAIRRVWPDVLVVNMVEQQPLAYWQSGGLINQRGELFTPHTDTYPTGLPMLSGPAGAEKTLLKHFVTVHEALQSIQLKPVKVAMDARHALVVVLDNGIRLVLGRNEAMARLEQFVRIYPKVLAKQAANIAQVDMRYTNGFTVKRKL